MKTRLLIIGMIVFSFILPQAFGDNEFCNIMKNLKIQEELIKDDVVLIEFLKVFPSAKLTRATGVEESNPADPILVNSNKINHKNNSCL